MVYYGIAFCLAAKKDTAGAHSTLKKASGQSTDYCFPYGTDQMDLLISALEIQPEDPSAWYYLGNIFADFQADKAIQCWENAVRLNPGMAIAWRNLADLYAHQKDEIRKSVDCINRALRINSSDPQYLTEADMYYGYAGIPPGDRLKLFTDHRDIIGKTDAATVKYNQLLVFSGRYAEALQSLRTRNIHAYERFNTNYHVTWVDAHVLEGIRLLREKRAKEAILLFEAALTFPRNLEIAEDSKAGIALYYLGMAHKLIGNADLAADFFTRSASGSSGSRWAGDDWPEVLYSRALSFQELGNKIKAEEIFRKLIADGEEIMNITPNPAAYTGGIERRWDARKEEARAYYSMALGNLGLNNKLTAADYFEKALKTEPSYLSAKAYQFSNGL
jgi:tetratricopeptide (TPR) repeat protein